VISDSLRKPNLIIVDGGKPQVTGAQEALAEIKVTDIPVIGLIKDDRHRTRGIMDSNHEEIILDKKSNLFLLLESMQDEVHRFAITFHQDLRSKTALESALDNIDGIGKKRKHALLANFENIEEIKKASDEKLASLGFSPRVIKNLMCALNGSDQVSR
jgi:excinuclease ABC subunit C